MNSREDLKNTKRLVVKIGSGLICTSDGLAQGRLRAISGQISGLKDKGLEIILVSSGAVAAGFRKLGLTQRPSTLRLKQASAAAGQVHLMTAWEKAFSAFGLKVAQILLTADDLADRHRFLNAKNTLYALLELGTVPIINENDTVAVEELKVGDNDTLGALVASLTEADLFINLTDTCGLFEADPKKVPNAAPISQVDKVTPKILSIAGGNSGPLGTGGMFTKVRAAGRLAERGLPSLIANGQARDILPRIISGENLGTFFKPSGKLRGSRKHWLAFATRPKGRIFLDSGATRAVLERGKSLLPKGVTGLEGLFAAGDAVNLSTSKNEADFGVGLVNYSSPELNQIMGQSSQNIGKILGYTHSDEIIHRDNLVLYSKEISQ